MIFIPIIKILKILNKTVFFILEFEKVTNRLMNSTKREKKKNIDKKLSKKKWLLFKKLDTLSVQRGSLCKI